MATKKTNTWVYVAIGFGVLALGGTAYYFINKNKQKTADAELDEVPDEDTTQTTDPNVTFENPEKEAYYKKTLDHLSKVIGIAYHVDIAKDKPVPAQGTEAFKKYSWGKGIYAQAEAKGVTISEMKVRTAKYMANIKYPPATFENPEKEAYYRKTLDHLSKVIGIAYHVDIAKDKPVPAQGTEAFKKYSWGKGIYAQAEAKGVTISEMKVRTAKYMANIKYPNVD